MKRKLLFTLIAIIAVIFTFTACSLLGDNSNPGANDGGTENPDESPKSTVINTIVFFDSSLDSTMMPIRSAMMDIVMPVMTVTDPASAPTDGEVVFGESDRPITVAAKARLSEILKSDKKNDIGYIIYSDGKNVAVYWMHENMMSLAIADFVDVCINEKKLVVEAGVAKSELYVKSEYLSEMYWIALEREASPELVAAYRQAYAFYEGDKIIDWIANLYDADIGGFYYSRSARDYETFLPDLESTQFALSLLTSLGAMTNRNEQLPVEMQKAMVEFVKAMQSPKDGYFYHKQWAQDKSQLKVDRYGRDLASASGFITSFYIDYDGDGVKEKQYPNWCIPGSTKCEIHTNTSERCSFPVASSSILGTLSGTDALGSSVGAAISDMSSSVVVATVSSHPDYSSAAAFRRWLEEYNGGEAAKDNSGNAHNIAELRLEIVANGYLDVVLDYLDQLQAEIYEEQIKAGVTPSGAWQREADYRAVWGIYKYLAIYNLDQKSSRKIDIKYVPYLLDTCLKVIAMPADGDYYVNDIMNQWTAVSRIITNVGWHYGQEEADNVIAYMRERVGPDLILNNLEKVKPFKVADGSFGYTVNGNSLSTIYGVPISLGLVEGDLNSVVLATGLYKAMFTTLGYTPVPLFDSDDLARFIEIIETSDPVEKKQLDFGALDFEDDEDMKEVTGSNGNGTMLVEITEDPQDYDNKVLHFVSSVAQGRAASITIQAGKRGSGCNVAQFDILVDNETSNGWMFQVRIGTSQHYTFHRSGNEVIIKATTDYSVNKTVEELGRFNVGEWTNVRLEYYYPTSDYDEIDAPITKLYIGEEYVATTELYLNSDIGSTPSSTYNNVYIYSMASVNTDIYLDNCYFVSETLSYSDND